MPRFPPGPDAPVSKGPVMITDVSDISPSEYTGERLNQVLREHLKDLGALPANTKVATPIGHFPLGVWSVGVLFATYALQHPDACLDGHLFDAYRHAVQEWSAGLDTGDRDDWTMAMLMACQMIVLEAALMARLGHRELLDEAVSTAPLEGACDDPVCGCFEIWPEDTDGALPRQHPQHP